MRGFETALDTVAGKAAIEIVATSGIDERLLPELGWLREFGTPSPVIEGEMAIVTGEITRPARRVEALKVLGVDILRDLTLREYVVGAADRARGQPASEAASTLTAQQFLELLTSPQSIVITEKLARRRGYALGSEVRLMAGDRVGTYIVRGLLEDKGPARVMDGSFVLMDIAAAQLAFDRLGRVDRIDLLLHADQDPGTDDNDPARIESTRSQIANRLPPGLGAQRPSRRGQQVERMLAAFHLNLTALSWVALIVGLFLVYNTVTISVIARREEIGILRALGVTSRQVQWLFLCEAAALGVLGTALGIALGRSLADLALGLTTATVSTLYIATRRGAAGVDHRADRARHARRRSPFARRGVAAGARSQPRAADRGDPRFRSRRVADAAARAIADRSRPRARACGPAGTARPDRRPAAVRVPLVVCHDRRRRARGPAPSSLAWRGWLVRSCGGCSASKACWRTPTLPRRFRGCRSRLPRWPPASR